ncbi:MAG: hypothetical protein IPF57_14255 [Gammaproteobacteria bacterium]|nr:hypothetical protein [Gammaproteobacteria bacterium]
MKGIDPRTPVLVGIGIVEQKEKDPAKAREAVQLMIDAVRAAGADCGAPLLPAEAQRIYVPQGLWGYADPARMIARAIGAEGARTVYAKVGILQQTLIGDACARIAAGEIETAIVVGGEARFRALQAQIAGTEAAETPFDEAPDEVLTPQEELQLPLEIDSGLGMMPVGYYAPVESAFAPRRAWAWPSTATAWRRCTAASARSPRTTRTPGSASASRPPRSAMPRRATACWPFRTPGCTTPRGTWTRPRRCCCARRRAEAPALRSRWVFPRASTESNHMLALSERPALHRLPGRGIAGQRAWSCPGSRRGARLRRAVFLLPVAVELYAAELGIPADRDWTVTGGMPFAGGPLNNYVLQATARMAELLRDKPGSSGLVSSVSGYLTKQGFGVWSADPGPRGFVFADVSAEVAAQNHRCVVVPPADGVARICGYTVMYHNDQRVCGVALLDLPDGTRTLANTLDQALMDRLESEECCHREAQLAGGRFSLDREP